jgi:hypothetical protein
MAPFQNYCVALVALAASISVGCNSPKTPMPANIEKIDHMVHDVANIANKLTDMAKAEGKNDEDLAAIAANASVVFDAGKQLHDSLGMHGNPAKPFDYATIDASVDTALTKLESYVAADAVAAEQPTADASATDTEATAEEAGDHEGHDHDDHDHEGHDHELPTTYADSVKELREIFTEIKKLLSV